MNQITKKKNTTSGGAGGGGGLSISTLTGGRGGDKNLEEFFPEGAVVKSLLSDF